METPLNLLSADFASALLAIIVIDLVLAGDNAIVIALAARSVPEHLRTRAIVWGTGGAVIVRAVMTLVVVWLLKIPGLLAVGGVLLIWIGYRLLAPHKEDSTEVKGAPSFGSAIRTIIVADTIMGLDNVVAVAGAARGSFLLVVLGLLISVPIMVWGSRLLLKWIERHPVIIYVGGGVLGWTAAHMLIGEPLLADIFAERPALRWGTYAGIVGGVLGAGWLANRRPAA